MYHTDQTQIIYQLVYHIFSHFIFILYFVSSMDSNMSKFILLDLNCNNGNSFKGLKQHLCQCQCYAVARRNMNYQSISQCQILQEAIIVNTVSAIFYCVFFCFTFLLLTLFVCGDIYLNPRPKTNRSCNNFLICH